MSNCTKELLWGFTFINHGRIYIWLKIPPLGERTSSSSTTTASSSFSSVWCSYNQGVWMKHQLVLVASSWLILLHSLCLWLFPSACLCVLTVCRIPDAVPPATLTSALFLIHWTWLESRFPIHTWLRPLPPTEIKNWQIMGIKTETTVPEGIPIIERE